MYYQVLLTRKKHFLGTYLYLHLVVLSRVPNLQHISLQLHNVCSHLDYLTLLTDGLVPKNKTNEKLKKYIHPAYKLLFIYLIIILVSINYNRNIHQGSLNKIKGKHLINLLSKNQEYHT